jgi:hypothetical protein
LSLKFANAGSVSVDDACGMPVTSGMYSIDTFGVENQTSASGDVVLPASLFAKSTAPQLPAFFYIGGPDTNTFAQTAFYTGKKALL